MNGTDPVQEIVQAAVAYAKARDHFHDVLRKYVDGHFKEGDPRAPGVIDLHTKVPVSALRLKDQVEKETGRKMPDLGPIGKRTDVQHPRPKKVILPDQPKLGKVTRVVVRGLIATFKEGHLFSAPDAAVCRPAPHNTRDGVYSTLKGLAKRGLIKTEEDGLYSIPDIKKLESALYL